MVFALVVAPLAMRVLTAAEPRRRAPRRKRELGTRFLAIFLVQLLFYAAGLVATALLQARRRFAAPAVAPLVNNLVVIAAYLLFDRLREGSRPRCRCPAWRSPCWPGGRRSGWSRSRPCPWWLPCGTGCGGGHRLTRDAGIARLARQGAWAGAYLAPSC